MKAKSCIEKLRSLGVLNEWRENVKGQSRDAKWMMERQDEDKGSFELFIKRSFVWAEKKEGHAFWREIAEK